MSHGRRAVQRRRRVLYTAHHVDSSESAADSRRRARRLREARRPAAAYGARVHRRLRGRWFSLVPVRRRTLVAVAASLAFIATLFCLGHYASVAWPAIATRPEIARPLRLDRPDSFGRWFTCVTRIVAAGAALLIYQLRRYRIDDYEGHYRLWRVVLLVMLVASLDAVVSITDWLGAILDMTLGQRVAMRGADWLRLLVTFGGTVLAMRLVAEVRRCRWSLAAMIAAWGVIAVPVGHAWNLFSVDTPLSWSLVTAAPLVADTLLLISLGGYLRSLYREVRQIEDGESLVSRVRQLRERWLEATRRRDRDGGGQSTRDDGGRSTGEPKRPRAKAEKSAAGPAADGRAPDSAELPNQKKKRRRFSLRLKPPTSDRPVESSDETDEDCDATGPDADAGAAEAGDGKRRRFRIPWARRRSAEADTATERDGKATASSDRRRPEGQREDTVRPHTGEARDDRPDEDGSDPEIDESLDPDEIDWSSLSKSARRRLRKQLKRQKRAA